MTILRKLFLNPRAWHALLGLALGLVLGVLSSSGLAFDKDSSARFLGAFFGSIVTVSGAICLYYLKEFEDKNKRLKELKFILRIARQSAEKTRQMLRDGADVVEIERKISGLDHHFSRAIRYAESHEFVDPKIGFAFAMLSLTRVDGFVSRPLEINDPEYLEKARLYVESRWDVSGRGLEYLDKTVPLEGE